jgi:hypothetical protein
MILIERIRIDDQLSKTQANRPKGKKLTIAVWGQL